MKTVFTTGEAAKICKVSQQTIIRCFDAGQLKGFRVPGSRFRRIPRDSLYAFMRDNGIPTDAIEASTDGELCIYLDPGESPPELIAEFYMALAAVYRSHGGSGLEIAKDELGICIEDGAVR